MDKVAAEAEDIAGHAFNIKSPKQVKQLLFEELRLPTHPNVNEEVLEELNVPITKLILGTCLCVAIHFVEHRKCAKLVDTYIDGYVSKAKEIFQVGIHFRSLVRRFCVAKASFGFTKTSDQ